MEKQKENKRNNENNENEENEENENMNKEEKEKEVQEQKRRKKEMPTTVNVNEQDWNGYDICLNFLSKKNKHERDDLILFDDEKHKYTILNDLHSDYISVTTWIGSLFDKFNGEMIVDKMMKGKNWNSKNKYWGMTREEILNQWKEKSEEAIKEGTKLHECIETIMNLSCNYAGIKHNDLLEMYGRMADVCTDVSLSHHFSFSSFIYETASRSEWQYVLNFMVDTPHMKPYRTEWRVFHEEFKLSGSIDMVYENEEDGTLDIYDWKRCKEFVKDVHPMFGKYCHVLPNIPDTNYWHYVLQLNTYRYILESVFYNKQIRSLFLVRFHPEATNYELVSIPLMDKREIENAFHLSKNNKTK